MRLTATAGTTLAGLLLCFPQVALSCTAPVVSASEMIRRADAIVRVVAGEYAKLPADANVITTGEPDSRVRFKVIEVIRGQSVGKELILPGYLSDRDDFNDQASPYSFVRPNGRSGSCFANTYRTGAQFLLVLKKAKDDNYTINWYALGPVNEQLRSESDPWLLWVRQEARRAVLPDPQIGPTRR